MQASEPRVRVDRSPAHVAKLIATLGPIDGWNGNCLNGMTCPAFNAFSDLMRVGRPAVHPLIGALSDREPWRRFLAILALGVIGDQAAVGPILDRMQRDDVSFVRRAAAEVLGRLRARAAVPALEAALDAPKEDVRAAAAEALGELRYLPAIPKIARLLALAPGSSGPGPGDQIAHAIARLGHAALPALVDAARTGDANSRRNALTAIGLVRDTAAVPALVRLLTDEQLQVAAIESLGEIGDHRAADAVAWTVRGRDDLQWRAAEALAKMGDPRGASLALERYTRHPDEWDELTRVAEDLADPRFVAPLSALLGGGEEKSMTACEALGRQQFPSARAALWQALPKSKYSLQRVRIQAALARLHDRRALRPMVEALRTGATHGLAADALGALGAPEAIGPLLRNVVSVHVCPRALLALARLRARDVVRPALSALNDPDASVRRAACTALGELRATEALPLLRAHTTDFGRDTFIRADDDIPVCDAAEVAIRKITQRSTSRPRP